MSSSQHPNTLRVRLLNTYEPVTTLYRDLFPFWVDIGWQVEVVTSRAEYRPGRERTWAGEGVRMRWMPGAGLKASGRLNKFLIMLLYVLGAAAHTLFGPVVDRNVFLTQPPLFYLWGRVLQVVREQPYFVVLMDLHPDLAVRAGLLAEDAVLTRILLQLSHYGLRRADGVIVIGRCMRRRVLDLGVAPERVHYIPNWTDEKTVHPIPHTENDFRRAQGWQDKFVVLYSGNMGTPHYFDDVLEVSRRLRDCADVVFVFIGHGQRRGEIARYKERHGLENVRLLPFQPLARLHQSLSAGNVHFVSLRPGFEGLVVPSKTYGILAAGRPILYQGAERGEIARMIAAEKVGEVVPPGDPDTLEAAIRTYLQSPALATEQGRRARQVAESKYSKQAACRRYTAVLQGQD